MQISSIWLSKTSKSLAIALFISSLLLLFSTFSIAFAPEEFVKNLLKEAGQENTDTTKFIFGQQTTQTTQNTQISTASEIFELQVVPTGSGLGAINSLDGKIKSCTRLNFEGCYANYPVNSSVTLIVNPALGSTNTFTGCLTSSENECTLTMNQSKLILVRFTGNADFATYLSYPRSGQILPVYSTIVLKADAVGNFQPISNVTFFASKKGYPAKNLGTDSTAPYNYSWIPLQIGEYELYTEVKSTENWVTYSPKISVTINESSLTPQCIDRDDGVEPFIKSNMTSFGLTYIDNCLNTTALFEFICDQDLPSAKVIPCELGCSQGVCISSPPPIRSKINIKGLLGWFSADEDPEFFHGLDSSMNNKPLKANGSITITSDENNPAYVFEGNSYAQITFSSFPFNYPSIGRSETGEDYNVTVSLWFNTLQTSGVLLGQSAVNPGTDGYPPMIPINGAVPAIYIGWDGKLRTTLFWDGFPPGDNGGRYVSDKPVNDGLWHSLVITYANRTEKVYLEGNLVNSREFTQSAYSSDYAYTLGTGVALGWDYGASATGWLNYKGKIDKLAIYGYSAPPSSLEITALFNEGRAGPLPPSPVQLQPVQPPVQSPANGGSGGGGGSSGGGSSGGGGGSSVTIIPKTHIINQSQLQTGFTLLLKEGEKINFPIENQTHTLTFLKINKDIKEGYFELKSEPQYFFLRENSTEKFDLTNDTILDLSLKMNGLIKDSINITLQSINESTKINSPITGEVIAEKPISKKEDNKFFLWLALAILIMIVYFFLSKKLFKPKKNR